MQCRIPRRAGALVGAMVLATAWSAQADTLSGKVGQIRLSGDGDYVLAAEEVAAGGAIIDTYRSRTATIMVIGRPGSSMTVAESADTLTGRRTAEIRISTARRKTIADRDAYRGSGRSTVADLVALGMPHERAVREFGDMDVPSRARVSSADSGLVASLSGTHRTSQLATAASATTPYDTLCARLSYDSGKITGYGCSTLFLVSASGGDWWFNNKYKFSAHSSDGSIVRPQRLFEVGWSLSWAANNVVYDWEPEATINRNDCGSVRLSLTAKGLGISVEAPICPSKISPWNLAGTRSGTLWQGIEKGQDYEAAIGLQAVHSPPNAPASYESPFKLVWGPFPP